MASRRSLLSMLRRQLDRYRVVEGVGNDRLLSKDIAMLYGLHYDIKPSDLRRELVFFDTDELSKMVDNKRKFGRVSVNLNTGGLNSVRYQSMIDAYEESSLSPSARRFRSIFAQMSYINNNPALARVSSVEGARRVGRQRLNIESNRGYFYDVFKQLPKEVSESVVNRYNRLSLKNKIKFQRYVLNNSGGDYYVSSDFWYFYNLEQGGLVNNLSSSDEANARKNVERLFESAFKVSVPQKIRSRRKNY